MPQSITPALTTDQNGPSAQSAAYTLIQPKCIYLKVQLRAGTQLKSRAPEKKKPVPPSRNNRGARRQRYIRRDPNTNFARKNVPAAGALWASRAPRATIPAPGQAERCNGTRRGRARARDNALPARRDSYLENCARRVHLRQSTHITPRWCESQRRD